MTPSWRSRARRVRCAAATRDRSRRSRYWLNITGAMSHTTFRTARVSATRGTRRKKTVTRPLHSSANRRLTMTALRCAGAGQNEPGVADVVVERMPPLPSSVTTSIDERRRGPLRAKRRACPSRIAAAIGMPGHGAPVVTLRHKQQILRFEIAQQFSGDATKGVAEADVRLRAGKNRGPDGELGVAQPLLFCHVAEDQGPHDEIGYT